MKNNLHPQFYPDAVIICACGNKIVTGSTVKEMHTEICSNCHPFYTGKQNLVDTMGRVDKFKRASATAVQIKSVVKVKKERKARTKK